MKDFDNFIKLVKSQEDVYKIDLKKINLDGIKNLTPVELEKIIKHSTGKTYCSDADRERINDILKKSKSVQQIILELRKL
jgi:hypothetical protein